MDIFIIEGNIVRPTPQALNIKVFSDIWENDISEKKHLAIAKFTFIEFMCSYKKSNPFIGYTDIDERKKNIINSIKIDDDSFSNGTDVEAAIKWYKHNQSTSSPSIKFYEAALNGADKLIGFFNTVSLNDRTRSGTPVYKPADVTRALKDTNEIIKTLKNLEERIKQELIDSAIGKGGREINYFEK